VKQSKGSGFSGLLHSLLLGLLLAMLVSGSLMAGQAIFKPGADSASFRERVSAQTLQFGIELSPGYSQTTYPGSIITYSHILTNTANITDSVLFQVTSSQGWNVITNGLGSGTIPGSITWTQEVGAGQPYILDLGLFVPESAISGTVDLMTITATSQSMPTLTATTTNTTTVLSRTYTLYLPTVLNVGEPPLKLGVDFNFLTSSPDLLQNDLPLARTMGAGWVRHWISWPRIETTAGQYDWQESDLAIGELKAAGFKILAVIYGAPEWAADEDCGPISDLAAFETFLEAVAARYATDIDAWEFTNEPDGRAPHQWSPTIGCWAPYPEDYADQLGIFYRKMKTLDYRAPILYGGLAYDNWTIFDRAFFGQTLQHGAGHYFDVLSLHYYPINPVEFPTMAHKVNEIQQTMAQHSVFGKQIWITETGMWVNADGSLEKQRDFIAKEFSRGVCNGVDNIFWFSVREEPQEPALHRWLISLSHQPDNAYYTYQNYAQKLVGMACKGPYQNVPAGIEAYQFNSVDNTTYIAWSNTGQQPVNFPTTIAATITGRDGEDLGTLSPQNGVITVNIGALPIFVEIPKVGD
jgi:hypothetical protein